MKKQIHTSPVAEAFLSGDECPFCYLQRDAEQRSIRYFAGAGASYMEPEVRGITNRLGFCTDHTKKLYDYGNSLGNALMLQTHMENVLLMLQQLQTNPQAPVKKGLFSKKSVQSQPLWLQIRQRADSCAICQRMEESQQRHMRVFFDLLKEAEFRSYVEQSKGFCLHHFALLLQEAEAHLPAAQQEWFYGTIYQLMTDNLQRVKEDLDLLISKYDYRNANLPWGNARDALQRAMQKMGGIHPADPPYRKD